MIITPSIIIGTLFMLSISVLVVTFVFAHRKRYLLQQNELQRIQNERDLFVLKAVIKTQEAERNRIAKNLHDSVGAELSMVQLNLTKYIHFLKPTAFDTEPLSQDITNLENAIENIRSVCHDLFPLTLQQYGLIYKLKQIAERIHRTGKINCEFSHEIEESEILFDLEQKVNVLRIYQELVNNILKHADCGNLSITVSVKENWFTIHLKHDGKPFTNSDVESLILMKNGLGLNSVKSRTELLGGNLDYSYENSYSEINIKLPMPNA